ncbi:MAG: hypothetical protein J3K34DRAFT_414528, partial [Monoraphidium minutum]
PRAPPAAAGRSAGPCECARGALPPRKEAADSGRLGGTQPRRGPSAAQAARARCARPCAAAPPLPDPPLFTWTRAKPDSSVPRSRPRQGPRRGPPASRQATPILQAPHARAPHPALHPRTLTVARPARPHVSCPVVGSPERARWHACAAPPPAAPPLRTQTHDRFPATHACAPLGVPI